MPVRLEALAEKHRQRHVKLHREFDELLADWILHTGLLPSRSSILQLQQWSHQQTIRACYPTSGECRCKPPLVERLVQPGRVPT